MPLPEKQLQDAASLALLPAPAQTVIAFPFTGDYRKDVLIESLDYRWNRDSPVGTAVTVTFSFADMAPGYATPQDKFGFQPFTSYGRELARQVLTDISSFTNLTFSEVPDSELSFGQIRFGNNRQTGTIAYAYQPFSTNTVLDGDVYVDTRTFNSQTSRAEDYSVLAHEIFHALGLKHPGNYDGSNAPSSTATGNFLGADEDSTAFTVMSYREVVQGQPSLGGIYDILTLQYLYGEGLNETGDSTYTLTDSQGKTLETLIDGGGIDSIDVGGISTPAFLELREGAFSSIGLVAPGAPAYHNLAIAFGTQIENAIGTKFDDSLTGNALANHLSGGDGRDHLSGLGGNDILDGGPNPVLTEVPRFIGDAVTYLDSGAPFVKVDLSLGWAEDGLGGIDTLTGIEDAIGSSGNDILIGDDGKNGFRGYGGDDLIDGRGNDPARGDFVSYFLDPAAVTVDLQAGTARDGFGGTDTLLDIENVNASNFPDILRGDGGRNILQGFNGNDIISGGDGVDTAGYEGKRSEYFISLSAGSGVVTDSLPDRDGTDSLSSIERLLFNDGVLAFDNLRTDNAGRGYLIYRAAFDRLPDVSGLGYWIRELDRGQDYGAVVAASFIASPEFIALNGVNTSNEQYANLLYQNVLHRAGDASGVAYWMAELNNGGARSNMLASFAISDENYTGVAPQISDGVFYV